MRLHLVDATYELFRAHFAPRPPVLGRDGIPLSGVSGLVRPAALPPPRGGRDARRLRDGPGHRVVPQRPLPGLQVVGRDAARAARPVPDRRGRRRGARDRPVADGRVRGRRRDRGRRRRASARTERVERILVCTPDKDMAQLVRDERVVLWDRRREPRLRRRRRPREVGRAADLDPGLARARRRHLGRLSRAARLGRQVGRGGPRPATATTRTIPPKASAWEVPGVGGSRAMTLAATLRDHWDEALLYRDLARLRTVGRRRPDPPARRRTSCAGTARRAPSGRRSARNGASTGWRGGRIAGSTRTDGPGA